MKTAVSLPDDIFQRAERLARRTRRTRSRLVADALDEYLARHEADDVTDAMNAALADIGEAVDGFSEAAARRT
ncbi:MAG: ribbon-helix-helix protein, CopG family, partial [Candidatus Eremiobacteraeota bacterium]|nr:ribbon-helix-helix protein, CopG family [Candidatus Eremiobacteraeota bacterium]